MNKKFVLLLIFISTASSLIPVEPAYSSATKPAIPEFTVELVDSSFEVPTSHLISRSIVVTVMNQPFVPYYDNSANFTISFHYNIRIKEQNSEGWIILYSASDGYPIQSDLQYTTISYALGENADTFLGTKMIEFAYGEQVDFQVEAMIGYIHRVHNPNSTSMSTIYPWRFTGETSGWSETQTLTINVPLSPSQTVHSDQSNSQHMASSSLDWEQLATLTLLSAIVLLVIVVVYLHRKSKVASQLAEL